MSVRVDYDPNFSDSKLKTVAKALDGDRQGIQVRNDFGETLETLRKRPVSPQ